MDAARSAALEYIRGLDGRVAAEVTAQLPAGYTLEPYNGGSMSANGHGCASYCVRFVTPTVTTWVDIRLDGVEKTVAVTDWLKGGVRRHKIEEEPGWAAAIAAELVESAANPQQK